MKYEIRIKGIDEKEKELKELKELFRRRFRGIIPEKTIEKHIEELKRKYQNKGYNKNEIKFKPEIVIREIYDDKFYYRVNIVIETRHWEDELNITWDKIYFTSKDYHKTENEIGKRIKEKIEIIKLKEELNKLRNNT